MRLRPEIPFAQKLDRQLAEPDHIRALQPHMFEWSRSVRYATGLTVAALAKRMGISQPAATKLEQSEAAGTISLAKLEELAEALDCRLVYGFIPKKPLEATAQSQEDRQERARNAHRKMPAAE